MLVCLFGRVRLTLMELYENVSCFTNMFSLSDFVETNVLGHDILYILENRQSLNH